MGKLLASTLIAAALLYFTADFFAHEHREPVDAQSAMVALLSQRPAGAGTH